jgi:hypothetical protein
MALINCPECNKQISDQAPACINCGFPLIQPKSLDRTQILSTDQQRVQSQDISNKEIVVALATKKSEGLAFIFTFFFGPFGLFYVSEKKALIVIAIAIVVFLFSLSVDNTALVYWGFSLSLWLVSIVIAMATVTEYNETISLGLLGVNTDKSVAPSNQNIEKSTDSIQELHRQIISSHGSPLIENPLKESILGIIHEICDDKAACYFLLKEYKFRYNCDLVEDLKKVSDSNDTFKRYLKPFIFFEFVSKDFPHNRI